MAITTQNADQKSLDPFYKAIRNNDLVALNALIQTAGVGGRDSEKNTPLLFAAAVGSSECVRQLLKAGANPNDANSDGATPLMWCGNDLVKVKALLEAGANVKAVSKGGHTPLEIVSYYDGSPEVMKLMIAKGADVNATDKGLITPLEVAAFSENFAGCKLLLEHGAKADMLDSIGATPLFGAAGSGYEAAPLVKLLLDHGAPVNALLKDKVGAVMNGPIALGRCSALQMAVTTTPEAVAELLKAGADVNQKDIRNSTALVYAVATDHANPKIVKMLLDHGAKASDAYDLARKYNNPPILRLLGLKPLDPTAAETVLDREKPANGQVMESVVRAMKTCQAHSAKFETKGGCFSCHAQVATGLAVWKAKPLKIEADYALEQKQTMQELAESDQLRADLLQVQDPPGAVDTISTYLLHLSAAQVSPNATTDAMIHYVCAYQRKEGDWPIASQVRPPLEDGSFSATAKAIHALTSFPIPALKSEIDSRIARGAAWLRSAKPVSTEDRSMQLLGLIWAGQEAPDEMVRQLVKRQRAGGGWGQTDSLPADAYATGEVLTTLHKAGMNADDPAYVRGVKFLLKNQGTDGTWHVATRSFTFQPYFESGFPYGPDQWISQQGSACAAIALANVFDKASK